MKSNNNQLNVPQAREAMDKFKMQAASERTMSYARKSRTLKGHSQTVRYIASITV